MELDEEYILEILVDAAMVAERLTPSAMLCFSGSYLAPKPTKLMKPLRFLRLGGAARSWRYCHDNPL